MKKKSNFFKFIFRREKNKKTKVSKKKGKTKTPSTISQQNLTQNLPSGLSFDEFVLHLNQKKDQLSSQSITNDK